MKQRTRVLTVMSTSGALVVGALIGAVYVTLSLGGSSSPAPVQVQQVSRSVPTSDSTTAAARKAAVVKPVKKVAAKTTAPTSTKARSLVNTNQAADPTSETPPPDTNGAGGGHGPNPVDPTAHEAPPPQG